MRIFKLLVICVLIFIMILSHYIRTTKENELKIQQNKPIHIFIDCATGPMLQQIIHMLNLPKDEKKIVGYIHFNQNPSFNAEKYNIHFLNIPNTPGKWTGYELIDQAYFKINTILNQNTNAQFIIHTNLHHSRNFLSKLSTIPIKNIKMVHLYEDGIGNHVASRFEQLNKYNFNLQEHKPNNFDYDWPYFLHLKYNVTYHFAFVEDIKSDFKKLYNLVKTATIEETNLYQLKKTLSDDIKKDLAQFYKLNLTFWEILFKNPKYNQGKKKVILLGSRPMSNLNYESELNLYKELISKGDYYYFFKPHPHHSALRFAQDLKKEIKDFVVIPNEVPIELFYLIDLEPDYIAGYSSSVFLSLPKNEFLYYIKRSHDDVYLPFLLKKGIISPDKVIDKHLPPQDLK